MMERLKARGEAIAREAQEERLRKIAAVLQQTGFDALTDGDAINWRGRGAVSSWLNDPLLRFAGRTGR